MSCEFYKELIFKKLDDEINDEEEKMLLEHLKNCKECQTDFKELSEIEDILNSQQMQEVPNTFSSAVIDKIKQPVKKRFFFRPFATVAAACVILVLAYYSHAFDNLLSSGNIVQKQNTNNSEASLQQDINKKLQGDDKQQMSSYSQSGVNEKKSDGFFDKNHQKETYQDSQSPIQKQAENNTSPTIQKSIAIAPAAGGTNLQDNAPVKEGTAETQTPPQASPKMFTASSIASSRDQSMYNSVATVTTEKQQLSELLKKYMVTQKSENEFELLKSEFDKLNFELKSKNINIEINEININSDVVLIVIN